LASNRFSISALATAAIRVDPVGPLRSHAARRVSAHEVPNKSCRNIPGCMRSGRGFRMPPVLSSAKT
jgi:hypothetical protein